MVVVSGCSKTIEDDAEYKIYRGMSENQLYDHAMTALKESEYTQAAKRFEALDVIYPFSQHSKQAQLNVIYAYFKKGSYAEAAATAERFIHLYPRDKSVDYAYYMRGVANFEQERGTFAKMFTMDVSWRDAGTQRQAYHDFLMLVKRFPHSRYYSDSMKRMIYLRNQFAKHEFNIAKYYFDRRMYVAALNRSNYVIKHYGQSSYGKRALMLSASINKHLHLNAAHKEDKDVLEDTYSTKKG